MEPIREADLSGLEWRQTSAFQRHYELMSGGTVAAELTFLKTFGTLARMATPAGSWTFKRTGFLTPVVTARVEGSEEDCAWYRPALMARNCQLTLAGGENLLFGVANFWASEWALAAGGGGEVLRMHNRGILHHGAVVELSEAGRKRGDALLLAGLCWYIMVLHMQDSVAVTTYA